MLHIQYAPRSVYGVEKLYPVNEDAQMICRLKGQKTLTEADIKILSEYGATFEQVNKVSKIMGEA